MLAVAVTTGSRRLNNQTTTFSQALKPGSAGFQPAGAAWILDVERSKLAGRMPALPGFGRSACQYLAATFSHLFPPKKPRFFQNTHPCRRKTNFFPKGKLVVSKGTNFPDAGQLVFCSDKSVFRAGKLVFCPDKSVFCLGKLVFQAGKFVFFKERLVPAQNPKVSRPPRSVPGRDKSVFLEKPIVAPGFSLVCEPNPKATKQISAGKKFLPTEIVNFALVTRGDALVFSPSFPPGRARDAAGRPPCEISR